MIWHRFEGDFLTLASELHEDARWQDLMNNLVSADSIPPPPAWISRRRPLQPKLLPKAVDQAEVSGGIWPARPWNISGTCV